MHPFLLDPIDQRILSIMQDDSRLSLAEIAERAGCSTTVCWRRVQSLKESGIIEKTVSLLNREKLNLGLVVFVQVRLGNHSDESLEEFFNAIKSMPEVLSCYAAFGAVDYMLKVIVPNIAYYEEVFHRRVRELSAIREIASIVAMREIKNVTALPLHLGAHGQAMS